MKTVDANACAHFERRRRCLQVLRVQLGHGFLIFLPIAFLPTVS